MSCDTNDKSIDLPSSISFSTPAVALVEVDDIADQISCDVQDQEETVVAEEPKGDCKSDNTCANTVEAAVNVPTGDVVPKLSITLPSSHVVEISQNFYWPLYTKPIDWIYQEHFAEARNQTELNYRLRRTAEELQSMSFFQPVVSSEEDSDDAVQKDESGLDIVIQQLSEEKEDWFNDLSGGQKSKVELVRKIFLHDRCPHVVLIDRKSVV